MTTPQICELCGKVIDEHFLILWDGVAHAGTYEGDEQRLCTRLQAEIWYTSGRAQALASVARGLKNLAGRLRNAGNPSSAERVNRYALARAKEGEAAAQAARRWRLMWTKPKA